LVAYLESELDNLVTDGAKDSKPTAGFQRVIQRAVIHVQSSGHEEVTGANVLVAIFAERESHAAYFLQEQDKSCSVACAATRGEGGPPPRPCLALGGR
jgi:ATP-dependent Clp protease ATP-binding subunit ClpA